MYSNLISHWERQNLSGTLSKVRSPTFGEEELRHNRLTFDTMKPLPVIPDPELQVGVKTDDDDDDEAPAGTTTTLINNSLPPLTANNPHRQKTIEDATFSIVNADARWMLEFPKRFRNRPPQLHLPSLLIPTAAAIVIYFSSPPSALLKVKSLDSLLPLLPLVTIVISLSLLAASPNFLLPSSSPPLLLNESFVHPR